MADGANAAAVRGGGTARTSQWTSVVKSGFVGVAVVGSAMVLWQRQTSDALLRVKSFPGAILEVAFWALPGLVLYLALARRPVVVIVEGVVICAVLIAQWTESATERSSTASLGPGL